VETLFRDRRHAGRELARRLVPVDDGAVVVALPRGGLPVAYEVARSLGAPLDVLVVRKLGAPGHAELAIGAIASGGARVLNGDLVRSLRLDDATIARIEAVEARELARRERLYRGSRPPLEVAGRTVILVDDGIATGATMLAAVQALKQLEASRVIVAAPVGAPGSLARLAAEADEVVCLHQPHDLVSVGQWFQDFSQTTDDEVRELLSRGGPTGHGS